jgi:predicted RNase H-like HicB family nuclease
MQYQILIQNPSDDPFQASVVGIPNCTVQATTKEAAIALAKTALQQQLNQGELVTINLEAATHEPPVDPWIKHMGIFADDPMFDDFLAEIAAYRQQFNAYTVEAL